MSLLVVGSVAFDALETPFGKVVVTGSRLVTTRAHSRRALAGPDGNFHDVLVPNEACALVDESPEMMAVV